MGIQNIEYFFNPKSAAVIGASNNPEKLGHIVLRNFIGKFDGKLYPINPKEGKIFNLKSYGSVLDIKDKIEMAVVVVPPNVSNSVVKECVEKGIKAVVVITAGYKEIGGEGIKREEELKEIIKGSETRIIGPNCLGVFDSKSGVDTLFLPEYKLERPKEGKVAIIAQSGAFGSVLMDFASFNNIGISKFISYGNAVDVNEVDLIEFLNQDKKTKCVAAYMEAVTDGEAFKERVGKVTKKTPVVVLKAGKTQRGSKAAMSHTGSLAGSYQVYKGILKQFGCTEASNLEQMFDYARILSFEKAVKGNKIAVVTNGGGFGVVSTDAIESLGMELIEFDKKTSGDLKKILPEWAAVHNPLDLIGDATPERYKKALERLDKIKEIDGILVIGLMQPEPLDSEFLDVMMEFKNNTKKKFVVCMAGGSYTNLHARNLEKSGIPVYSTPERAAFALKALFDYGRYLG